ncbi:MAG: extracellular matrix/biofilm biosynthesis regulator RemA family protein [Chloroflexota bacterium]
MKTADVCQTSAVYGDMNWIQIDHRGILIPSRIVAVGSARSAPLRRLLGDLPRSKIIDLTGGRKRQTIVVLDSGHVAVTALTVEEIVRELERTL